MTPDPDRLAELLSDIEWRERFGFDIGDLVEEALELVAVMAIDRWRERVAGVLPAEAFV